MKTFVVLIEMLQMSTCYMLLFFMTNKNSHFWIPSFIFGYPLRPNEKITVFRVTRRYLNLLVKPSIFFRFSGKNIISCILKGEMPFKMHKIIYFSRKKQHKKTCVSYRSSNFQTHYPKHTYFFIWPYQAL